MKSFCHIYAQWDQVGSRIGEESKHLLDLGLVCDTTFDLRRAEQSQGSLHAIAAVGGLCAPNIYPAHFDPSLRDPNWWKYSEAQCTELLGVASEEFSELGLGAMRAINTYTTGNGLVSACRRKGVRYILGFCAPVVIEDGDWEISHYGSPLSPFFISDEDFRKPEAGERDDAVLMASMELRNPMVCLNHWSEGPWCPLNALAADRWLEPSADPLPFLQIAEDWLRQTELSGRPLFFHINLQYFFAGRCYAHNRRALEWLAEQRDKGRLEIGGLQDWAARLKNNEGFQRQTTYWRGEMMGSHVGHRPGCYPDVIVDENLAGQTIWQYPEALPRRRYDYRQRWDIPSFQPDGSSPASASFVEDHAKIELKQEIECERVFEINLESADAKFPVPVAIWNAFEGWRAPFEVKLLSGKGTMCIAPHPSGSGGALLIETGSNEVQVRVKGVRSTAPAGSRRWGSLVAAQTFHQNRRPYTVIAAQTPEPFLVEAHIVGLHEEPVIVESLSGIEHTETVVTGGRIALAFDGTRLACWHRVWGLSAAQIEIVGVEVVEEHLRRNTADAVSSSGVSLTPTEPGYQCFGNIRDISRWDRKLARVAGELEIQRMNAWFREQRTGVGETVIEVHPGIYLPRGSITKVLGHEFDFVKCAEGYGFRELCVDYPQGWDWGVAAWVQWRHLRIRLEGLRPDIGTHLLHLHAFDPEGRDISQRVHFFNPDATGTAPIFEHIPVHRSVELCAIPEWTLPKGVANRRHPATLCSVEIPEVCLSWAAIGVWIVPLEKCKLYDWVAERGAPGLLSHLWVTCSR